MYYDYISHNTVQLALSLQCKHTSKSTGRHCAPKTRDSVLFSSSFSGNQKNNVPFILSSSRGIFKNTRILISSLVKETSSLLLWSCSYHGGNKRNLLLRYKNTQTPLTHSPGILRRRFKETLPGEPVAETVYSGKKPDQIAHKSRASLA